MSVVQQDGTLFVPLANQPRMRSQGKVVLERNQDMRGGGRRRQRGKGWLSSLGDAIDVGKGAYGIYKRLKGGKKMKGGWMPRPIQNGIHEMKPWRDRIGAIKTVRGEGRRRQRGKGLLDFLL